MEFIYHCRMNGYVFEQSAPSRGLAQPRASAGAEGRESSWPSQSLFRRALRSEAGARTIFCSKRREGSVMPRRSFSSYTAARPEKRTVPSYHLPNVTAKESQVQRRDGEKEHKPYIRACAFTWGRENESKNM